MKYCPNCGTPVEDGHKFCANCGARLAVPERVVMPPEPVYTDDPALKEDPVLGASPAFDAPAPKEEKVPELTLEPDLWGLGTASAAQTAPQPAPVMEPTPAPAPVQKPTAVQQPASVQAPSFASVMEDVPYDNPLREERKQANELPHDYTMSQPQTAQTREQQPQDVLLNENLLLAWSIVLTAMCNLCGIVGLVKTIKARKLPLTERLRLLNSAKIWLIVGTALYALGFIGGLF